MAYSHLICEYEVYDVEDYDETDMQGIKRSIEEPEEPNETAKKVKDNESYMSINSLPEDIHLEIFQYLDRESLCRGKRVCKMWYKRTTHEDLWKKTTCHLHCLTKPGEFVPRKISRFIEILPPYVTHLDLSFDIVDGVISFLKFSEKIRNYCPNLLTLILNDARFDVFGDKLEVCTHMPASTKVIVLHNCAFKCNKLLDDIKSYGPKIEVLDLSGSVDKFIDAYFFLLLKHLRKLHLAKCFASADCQPLIHDNFTSSPTDLFFASVVQTLGHQLTVLDLELTPIGVSTFHMIGSKCIQLRELYVCSTFITDKALIFNESETVLPKLKIICLRYCAVTKVGIKSFMESCKSVEHIYVGSDDDEIIYFDLDVEKVHVLNSSKKCNHHKEVNYMLD